MKKSINLVTIVVLLLLIVSIVGCGKDVEDTVRKSTLGVSIKTDVVVMDNEIAITSTAIDNVTTTDLMTTDATTTDSMTESADGRVKILVFKDQVVYLDEAVIYIINMKTNMEKYYGESIWDYDSSIDTLYMQAVDLLLGVKVTAQMAKDEGIKVDTDELKSYTDNVDAVYDSIPQDLKDKYGITKARVREVLTDFALNVTVNQLKTKDLTYPEEQVVQGMKDKDPNFALAQEQGNEVAATKLRAKHILIMTIDEQQNSLTAEQKAVAKKTAEDVLARAKVGEDFDALTTEFSQDPGKDSDSYTDDEGNMIGYTFGRGEMITEFETAAYAMKVGEISGIVETDYGYHIIKLEEIIGPTAETSSALQSQFSQLRTSVIDEFKQQSFNELIVEWKAINDLGPDTEGRNVLISTVLELLKSERIIEATEIN